ncbi:MAG: enoyl-CoA hydratase/isomerase family protein [Betaproteobacteria bacterium]|nr:enoyl-CoA hydratase/isomerase family protein [Betaproteobacteria bacterium]
MTVLQLERQGSLTRATLNRPDKTNALDAELVEACHAAINQAATDGTRLLVFGANGKNFSAGFDFTRFEEASVGELLWRFVRIEQLLQALYHAPFATAAFAHGRNFGAGADLFIACDARIATAEASFRMPGLLFGLQLGTRRLVARIGAEPARVMLGEATTVGGQATLPAQFATHIAPTAEWSALEQQLLASASTLEAAAAERLRRAARPDTRTEDLADLVASVTDGDVKERIRRYRQRT